MADEPRPERLYCYQCQSVWAREAESPLQCPICESDFVEIVETDNPPPDLQLPRVDNPPGRYHSRSTSPFPSIDDHGWRPDIRTEHLEIPGGGTTFRSFRSGDGRFSFASTSFRPPRGSSPHERPQHDIHNDPFALLRNTTALLHALTENRHARVARTPGPPGLRSPFAMPDLHEPHTRHGHDDLGLNINGDGNMLRVSWRLTPRNAYNAREDTDPFAHLQEVLGQFAGHQHGNRLDDGADREVTAIQSLMLSLLQNIAAGGGTLDENADQPVTPEQLALLKTQTLKETLQETDGALDRFDGTETCGICMETVDLDSRVTVLPCKHWFHATCISPWLDDHNTCPHCRARIGRRAPPTPNGEQHRDSGPGPASDQTPPPRSASAPHGIGSMADPFIISDSPPRRSSSGNGNRSRSPRSSTNRDGANALSHETERLRSRPGHDHPEPNNFGGWLWNWLYNNDD
ncbi:hypothetical protein RJZ56_007795 [Blastomyces dermatitidis]|uniref:RING-type E3 ubiquitin transferase n=2 Tax=Ajellomyces dermatitidis TaxID=5039 RepID=F2TL71_AJEDA|nr:uncharacterized protein BDCG_07599 [Blastomyces dermatitidis ER-3]EEQ92479.1 hypothetical protein BDCG_07599 [Blastomyces dermatitidis ER-3]EGE83984.1 hypothetical protein BDDG_06929 [Blastomyces dermatitidis ATCC 18188]EQL35187.1 hypothetical protein BDFG_03168 [Blastomyces dermatitidis ATCC 26199]